MAMNTAPVFTRMPSIDWATTTLTTANTALDGTGTVHIAATAGANGEYVRDLRFRSLGTNVQTVARIFINNGGDNAVAANNILFDEITLPATTAAANAAIAPYVLPLNLGLPAGYRILVTLGTTVAAGYRVSAVGGDFSNA